MGLSGRRGSNWWAEGEVVVLIRSGGAGLGFQMGDYSNHRAENPNTTGVRDYPSGDGAHVNSGRFAATWRSTNFWMARGARSGDLPGARRKHEHAPPQRAVG